MARSFYSDFVVYDEEYQGAFIETVMQNVDAFNAASGGAIVQDERPLLGHYEKEAFWDEVVGANAGVTRRNIDSSSLVTAIKLTQDELVGVKLNRRNGPYEMHVDSVRKAINAAASPEEAGRIFSNVIARQSAVAIAQEMLDRALAALEAKLDSVAALEQDATDGILQTNDLVQGLKKFGDAAGSIILWVMHSGPYYDLVGDQISNAIYRANSGDVVIREGIPATLGRPVLVTDSASLVESGGISSAEDAYSTLGLVRRAAVCTYSEPPFAAVEGPYGGAENIYYRWQGEYAWNLKLRGCEWDVANGGSNPTNAALATATNWDTQVQSNKLLPGIIIKSRNA